MPLPEQLQISTAGTEREAPLTRARRYVDRELDREATAEEITWLADHPFMWLRALIQVRADVRNHINQDRAGLARSAPEAGEAPSRSHLAAVAKFEAMTVQRMHFVRIVERRIEDVSSILGVDPADRTLVGDLVQVLFRIAQLADDDDIEAVKDAALRAADRLVLTRPNASARAQRRLAKKAAKNRPTG